MPEAVCKGDAAIHGDLEEQQAFVRIKRDTVGSDFGHWGDNL